MTTLHDTDFGAAARRGPFRPGDKVQLTDAYKNMYTITLVEGGWFNVNKGSFAHSELLGKPEGTVVASREGKEYIAFRPTHTDYVLSMPRGATIVYPKDIGQIIQHGDIFPGARVVEAGAGSGALSSGLLQAIGTSGTLHSFERREEFAEIARNNVALWFGASHPAWHLHIGDLASALDTADASDRTDAPNAADAVDAADAANGNNPSAAIEPHSIDRVVLDMLAPWENIDTVYQLLAPGGVFTCYVATVTQMSRLAEDLVHDGRFTKPYVFETMQRTWHVDGLAVRPDHTMIGHTGFILVARAIAQGSRLPQKKKKGVKKVHEDLPGQWDDATDWDDSITGQRPISRRKLKRVIKDTSTKAQMWTDASSDTLEEEHNGF